MRLVLLMILLLPAAAHAAPVVAVLSTVIFGTITVGQVLLTVGMMIYGAAQQRKAEQQAREQAEAARAAHNASLQDRTLTGVSAENPHVYVYGRARVGSTIVAIFTSGDKDQYKHLVCVHAAHECDAIEDIFVAGQSLGALDVDGNALGAFTQITTSTGSEDVAQSTTTTLPHAPIQVSAAVYWTNDPTSGGEQVAVTVSGNDVTVPALPAMTFGSSEFGPNPDPRLVRITYTYAITTSNVRVKKHLGTPTDPADATLMAELPGYWPSTAVLRGFCYTVVRINLNQPEFQGGIPPIEVLMRGKKLYDPRSATTYWSQNPALVAYDYLTSEMCGVPASDLPAADFITAANVCDEAQSFGLRYTFNGTVTAGQDQAGVLEKMAQAMAGGIVATTWGITAGKYIAPVMALDQADIVGKLAITPGISDANLYNGVRGQYISPETQYIATDFTPFQNAAYLASDGRELWTNIDFPFTDSLQRVHNLARIFTEDQRNGYIIKAEFSLKAWGLQIGQRVTLTSAFFGWSSKIFRVTDKSYTPNAPVELTLKEDDPSIWDFADAVVADSTPNTNLKNQFAIDQIANLQANSGTNELLLSSSGTVFSRIRVTWDAVTSPAVFNNGTVEIEYKRVIDPDWIKTSTSGSQTQAYLVPVDDLSLYLIRARAVNPYLNVKSDWTYISHTVLGKSEPPPNITDLSISGAVLNWTPVSVLDLAGYVFRFHYGANFDWGSAVPMHAGLIVSSPFDLGMRPAGMVTIMGKAVDTSGNESPATGNIVTDFGDAPIANVVETIDFGAAGYPGIFSGCALTGGNLIASSLDSAYGTDSQSFYGLDIDPVYELSTYAEMVYTTAEIAISSVLAGSVMTLIFATQGTDLSIEYRLAGPGSAYVPDADSAYGPDADPFYGPPGSWIAWPGQIIAAKDVYQFRITIGAGTVRGEISALSLVIDAPDIIEFLNDIPISASGTVVPYTSNFTSIKTVTATLQANASGAETIEVDKTSNLAPKIKAYNASHTAVSGATADIIVKGY